MFKTNKFKSIVLSITPFLFFIPLVLPASASTGDYVSDDVGVGSVAVPPQSLKASMTQNFIEWPMNGGDTVELTNNFNSCPQFDSVKFTANKYFKGKLTVKEVNSGNDTYFPNKNKIYGACELNMEGFSSSDIQSVTLVTRYTKDWMRTNNIDQNSIKLFMSSSSNSSMSVSDNSKVVGEVGNYVVIENSLSQMPYAFAVGSTATSNAQVLEESTSKVSMASFKNYTLPLALSGVGILALIFFIIQRKYSFNTKV